MFPEVSLFTKLLQANALDGWDHQEHIQKITVLGGYGEVPLKTMLRANMAMSGTETGCVPVAFSQSICAEGRYGGRDNKSHLPANTLKMVLPI